MPNPPKAAPVAPRMECWNKILNTAANQTQGWGEFVKVLSMA